MSELASSLRILVVDDDAVACDALRRLVRPLRSRESLLCACATAEDALSLASRVEFDVILCDLHLSGLGAMAFCATLEKTNPALAARTILMDERPRSNQPRAQWAGRRVLQRNAQPAELIAAIADVASQSLRAAS